MSLSLAARRAAPLLGRRAFSTAKPAPAPGLKNVVLVDGCRTPFQPACTAYLCSPRPQNPPPTPDAATSAATAELGGTGAGCGARSLRPARSPPAPTLRGTKKGSFPRRVHPEVRDQTAAPLAIIHTSMKVRG